LVDPQGLVTGVSQTWEFDDGYAQTALEGLDLDKDGKYSETEIKPLTDENISSLKEYDYFTVVRQAGIKQLAGEVTKASQSFENNVLRLTFEVPLAKPVDPHAGEIQVKVYDPEFFIAYDYAEQDPFKVQGSLPSDCRAELKPVPTDAELEQTRNFLADKPVGWKSETEEDFGAVFARPLSVTCSGAGVVPAATLSRAESTIRIDKSKLLVQQRGAENIVPFTQSPVIWMQQQQRAFYGKLSGTLRQMRTSNAAVWTLLGLSFLYGVLHAAGPGHGKVVVSTWLLATENDVRRGVLVAFLSAFIQALTAVVLVSALFMLVASAGAVARNVAGYLEAASYAMIAALGLYLVWTAIRPRHDHDQSHTHGKADHDHHHHDQHHVHDQNCGHAHVASPQDVRGEWSFGKAFSLAFAVGIRPCTGAILVLVFANSLGLYWAGIASTFAMAAGVFLAISLIAAASVYARQTMIGMAGTHSSLLPKLLTAARILGGMVVAALGTILFLGSLTTGNTMM
jgi:nickel/cobalt transporter (NicO) family protein